jgi:hypothetical protein
MIGEDAWATDKGKRQACCTKKQIILHNKKYLRPITRDYPKDLATGRSPLDALLARVSLCDGTTDWNLNAHFIFSAIFSEEYLHFLKIWI